MENTEKQLLALDKLNQGCNVQINNHFIDNHGTVFPNVREIAFQSEPNVPTPFGVLKNQSPKRDAAFPFLALGDVYIYQSNYDFHKALRIYKNPFDVDSAQDVEMIQKLQERQDDVLLTKFPTGIVTLYGWVVGQEIPFFPNLPTLLEYSTTFEHNDELKQVFINIIRALHELERHGIFYRDVNAGNFLIYPRTLKAEIIDFDPNRTPIDCDRMYSKHLLLLQLKMMLQKLGNFTISKADDFRDFEEAVHKNMH